MAMYHYTPETVAKASGKDDKKIPSGTAEFVRFGDAMENQRFLFTITTENGKPLHLL